MAKAPPFSRWVITSAGAGEGRQVSVTKTGDVFHRETVRDSGGEVEQWWVRRVQTTRRKNDPGLLVAGPGSLSDSFYIDFSNSDFPEFSWVNRNNYLGVQKYQNVDCFVFKGGITREMRDIYFRILPEMTRASNWIVAWVDVNTRLPVALATDVCKQTYLFVTPPKEALMVPDSVAKEIAAWEERSAETSRPVPKP